MKKKKTIKRKTISKKRRGGRNPSKKSKDSKVKKLMKLAKAGKIKKKRR